jgi:type VI secretion system protein ImpH
MKDPAREELFQEPWRFEFAQAMRVLLRNSSHGGAAGAEDRRFHAKEEPVRIGAHQSLAFPASDIECLNLPKEGEKAKMFINFLGLTGPSGVLPLVYTQFFIDQKSDDAPAEFFDIFNHRTAILFYYAWEKYRFPVVQERCPEDNVLFRMLLSLIGLGTEHLGRKEIAPDEFFSRYAAILAVQPRSASALETILGDYFEVPVEVEQLVGNWYPLDENSVTRIRDEESESGRLGYGVVVGEEYWSHEFMARLRIGPLDMSAYKRFLPGGPDLRRIQEICRFFSRDELVFEVQLVLGKDHVPGTRLAFDQDGEDSRLGWTTWARSPSGGDSFATFDTDAGDVIIRCT